MTSGACSSPEGTPDVDPISTPRTHRLGRGGLVASLALVMGTTGLCGPTAAGATGGAPSIKICGHEVWSSPVSPVVQRFRKPGHYVVAAPFRPTAAGLPVILRFGTGCARGYRLRYEHGDRVKRGASAAAKDGGVVGITLVGRKAGDVRVVATRKGQRFEIDFHVDG